MFAARKHHSPLLVNGGMGFLSVIVCFVKGDRFWRLAGNDYPVPGSPREGSPLTDLGFPADIKKVKVSDLYIPLYVPDVTKFSKSY